MKQLSVIVAGLSASDNVINCLDNIAAACNEDMEIIVTASANDNVNGTVKKFISESDVSITLKGEEKDAFTKKINSAIKDASGKYIYFYLPGTIVAPDSFKKLLDCADKNGAVCNIARRDRGSFLVQYDTITHLSDAFTAITLSNCIFSTSVIRTKKISLISTTLENQMLFFFEYANYAQLSKLTSEVLVYTQEQTISEKIYIETVLHSLDKILRWCKSYLARPDLEMCKLITKTILTPLYTFVIDENDNAYQSEVYIALQKIVNVLIHNESVQEYMDKTLGVSSKFITDNSLNALRDTQGKVRPIYVPYFAPNVRNSVGLNEKTLFNRVKRGFSNRMFGSTHLIQIINAWMRTKKISEIIKSKKDKSSKKQETL